MLSGCFKNKVFRSLYKMKKVLLNTALAAGVAFTAFSTTDAQVTTSWGGSLKGGVYARVYEAVNGTSLEGDDHGMLRNTKFGLQKGRMNFRAEMGECKNPKSGAFVEFDLGKANRSAIDNPFTLRQAYVYAGTSFLEVRLGQIRSWSSTFLMGSADVMGGTGGHDGHGREFFGPNQGSALPFNMANNLHGAGLVLNSARFYGVQLGLSYVHDARVSGQGFGHTNRLGMPGADARMNINGGINYENTFGDTTLRLGAAVSSSDWGQGNKDATGAVIPAQDFGRDFAYRLSAKIDWKDLEFGLDWIDNLKSGRHPLTGLALNADQRKDDYKGNCGKIAAGAVGYTFSNVTMKPKVAVSGEYAFLKDVADKTLASTTVMSTLDLQLREGLKWYLEAGFSMRNDEAAKDKDGKSAIVGTGLSVSW